MKQIPIISHAPKNKQLENGFRKKMNSKYASNKESWHVSNVLVFVCAFVLFCFVSFRFVCSMTFHSNRIHAITLKSNGFERNGAKQSKNRCEINETERKKPTRTIVVSILSPVVYTRVRIDWFSNLQHISIPTYALLRTFLFHYPVYLPIWWKNERKNNPTNIWWNTTQKSRNIEKQRKSRSYKQ